VRDVVLAAQPIGARQHRRGCSGGARRPASPRFAAVIGVSELVILRLRDPPNRDAEPPPKADAFAFEAERQVIVKELVMPDFVSRDLLRQISFNTGSCTASRSAA